MLRFTALSLASLGLAPAAHAFCGTYVGGAGANLYNKEAIPASPFRTDGW